MKNCLTNLFWSLVLIGVFATTPAFAQIQTHSKVKIFGTDTELNQLRNQGLPMDHGLRKPGYFFVSDFSASELDIIKASGLKYEVMIEDIGAHYADHAHEHSPRSGGRDACDVASNPVVPVPADFSLGSMGGFLTYQEFLNHLDTMAAKYPNLITARAPIDTFQTHEGRPIYWLRISDNPTMNESEPEVLYTSVHHAREPGSLAQIIFYMYHVLENYGTDPEITYIVDNTEMYFVPMINPDGYIFNEVNDPNGGGLWRKNRRNNGDGTFGVDLNRNYGYNWGLDNTGSSPVTSSNTYRGPAPFSEPETQAVKWFAENHNFEIALNYHTFGNLLIYPWGYGASIFTPDSAQFVEYAEFMTQENNYLHGTGDQTVGYVVNGDSDDWMYGEQTTKNKILSCTPEVGSGNEGFWPNSSSIIPQGQANVRQNLNMALLVGNYARVDDASPSGIDQLTGYFNFDIKRLGMQQGTFTVSINPVGTEISSVGSPVVFNGMNLLESRTDSISFSLDPAIQNGQTVTYELIVDNGSYAQTQTITKTYGQAMVAFADDANTTNNWDNSFWGVSTTTFYTPSGSITDSPVGPYSNNDFNPLTLNSNAAIDLTDAMSATVKFWAKWDIEAGFDYAQVQGSTDGTNWAPLCGNYTVLGNNNQDQGQPLYDGESDWVYEEMKVNDFVGGPLMLRFVMVSDNFVTGDGFYFDDLVVEMIEDSTVSAQYDLNDPFGWEIIGTMPNPANEYTYVNYNLPEAISGVELQITNTLGQVVRTQQVPSGRQTVRLETIDLKSGVYFYHLRSGDQRSTSRKMVVVH